MIAWLKQPSEKDSFVRRHIDEIRNFDNLLIAHVPSEDNPADDVSRGLSSSELKESLRWWHGPSWLLDRQNWPDPSPSQVSDVHELSQPPATLTEFVCPIIGTEPIFTTARYSNWQKAINVAAYAFRFLARYLQKIKYFDRKNIPPHLNSINNIFLPTGLFQCDIITLKQKQFVEKILVLELQARALFPRSHIQDYNLFQDEFGLWRSRGRIEHNEKIKNDTKFPIYLPRPRFGVSMDPNWTSRLIIFDSHIQVEHDGPKNTLQKLRAKYWVPQGRKTVAAVIKAQCFRCRLYFIIYSKKKRRCFD